MGGDTAWWHRDRMSPISIIALFWAMCSKAWQSLLNWAGSEQGHWPGARSQGLSQVPSLARRRAAVTRAWRRQKHGALRRFSVGRSRAPGPTQPLVDLCCLFLSPSCLPALSFLSASLSLRDAGTTTSRDKCNNAGRCKGDPRGWTAGKASCGPGGSPGTLGDSALEAGSSLRPDHGL